MSRVRNPTGYWMVGGVEPPNRPLNREWTAPHTPNYRGCNKYTQKSLQVNQFESKLLSEDWHNIWVNIFWFNSSAMVNFIQKLNTNVKDHFRWTYEVKPLTYDYSFV